MPGDATPKRVLHVRIPWDIHIVTFGANVCAPSLPAQQKVKKTKTDMIAPSLTNAWGRDPEKSQWIAGRFLCWGVIAFFFFERGGGLRMALSGGCWLFPDSGANKG